MSIHDYDFKKSHKLIKTFSKLILDSCCKFADKNRTQREKVIMACHKIKERSPSRLLPNKCLLAWGT